MRLATYALIWLLLTGGDTGSWLWGLPAIAVAALFNPFEPNQRWRLDPASLLRFVGLFLQLSLQGAVDTAWRTLNPRRRLTPALVDYVWRLPPNGSRIFLANIINLMPGTLCVRITDDAMTMHTIGDSQAAVDHVSQLEAAIAGMLQQQQVDADD
ncbi:Na+/H+ antiporter subunit E [Aquisalimonas asiatica]|uniref:Multicomponent Na+:H+ antiporter subunit E n=1 Tax=Aquisalimonas asiatica TaxID=406100 RepID=A0A1H8PXR6_9GAMM|nr:Na+/H+ antiporter subunit E [Aquisalimonas asiatica]SEO46802.1 multicomponent Na+:H+ antiporter subunit E [Aquisalimonas asiatica]